MGNPIITSEKNLNLVSSNYNLINTNSLDTILKDHGFNLDKTVVTKTKIAEKVGHQKHRLVYSNDNFKLDSNNKFQLLVTNSHDGTSSLIFNIGIYRLICANGMIVGNSYFDHRVSHVNKSIESSIEDGLKQLPNKFEEIACLFNRLNSTCPEIEAVNEFKRQSADLRLVSTENELVKINYNTVGRPRRIGDMSNDAYTIFNRVQESLIRGGIKYLKEVDGVIKRNTTKKITSIKEDKRINQGLFTLAEDILLSA